MRLSLIIVSLIINSTLLHPFDTGMRQAEARFVLLPRATILVQMT